MTLSLEQRYGVHLSHACGINLTLVLTCFMTFYDFFPFDTYMSLKQGFVCVFLLVWISSCLPACLSVCLPADLIVFVHVFTSDKIMKFGTNAGVDYIFQKLWYRKMISLWIYHNRAESWLPVLLEPRIWMSVFRYIENYWDVWEKKTCIQSWESL